jgi:RteC protein
MNGFGSLKPINLWEESCMRVYIEKRIENACIIFFKDNRFWVVYHRTGKTDLDMEVYTSESVHLRTMIEVVAARHFEYYLNPKTDANKYPSVQWSQSKIAAVEIIYAFAEAGVVKNTTIKQVAQAFSLAFGLELTDRDLSQNWQEIKARKKDKSPFLHKLVVALLRRIENQDAP